MGKATKEYNESNSFYYYDKGFCSNPIETDRTFSLDTMQSEISFNGKGDFRIHSIEIERENGINICDFRYDGYKIEKGKKKLDGLPSLYGNEKICETLYICMIDEITKVKILLSYTIYDEYDIIVKNLKFIGGIEKVKLNRALTLNIDFSHHNYDLLTLYGSHINEKNIQRQELKYGIQVLESVRGSSSPQATPFISLLDKNSDEKTGNVYGINLIYSGNFFGAIQVEQYGTTRVLLGINQNTFSWELKPNMEFIAPEIALVYSDKGLNKMSQIFHKAYIDLLYKGNFQYKERPIVLNNWEATYFDFNEEKILELAKKSKEIGIELFVLDDGWFGNRNDDNSSLGDWFVNLKKLPNGLSNLVEKINEMGLKFGIWFEPEMISENSELFRKNPDWYVHIPDYKATKSRNQYVLDLTREEIVIYLYETISNILNSANIKYVKWDMNRHITEASSISLPKHRQKEFYHRYILGLYNLLEKLTKNFPDVLFENCSSGGGRFDAGMLYYMPQTWASDNTDAISRLKIQYGTSLIYPPLFIVGHVSEVPNHQTGRITPIKIRTNVAMSGNFGYELNLNKISEEEKEIIKKDIEFYKEYRNVFQFGKFYRLKSPFLGNEASWCFVKDEIVIVMYFKILSRSDYFIDTLYFQGLDENKKYLDIKSGKIYGGDELMYIGFTIPIVKEDFNSMRWIFKRLD